MPQSKLPPPLPPPPFGGSAGKLWKLRQAIEREYPLCQIEGMARDVLVFNANELLSRRTSRVSAIDELGTGVVMLASSPWTQNLFPPLLGVHGGLLSRDAELRAEEGAFAKAGLRQCLAHLDKFARPSAAVEGNKALLLMASAMLDQADRNFHGALDASTRAQRAVRNSRDAGIERLVLRVHASILRGHGDIAAADAFQAMADGIAPAGAVPVWLDPRLWGVNGQVEMEALAA